MNGQDRSDAKPASRRTAQTSNEKTGTCAICGRPRDPAFSPFCSRRCADEDLSRWLSGAYVIPGASREADDD